MIALIDYKAGNLTSVRKAFAAIGAELYDPASPADLERAAAIVVPGVGHFGATAALDRDWVAAIRAHVADGRPLLGICLGLQWLFAGSEEAPDCPGLGLLSGTCYRLKGSAIKVPHVGGTAWPSSVEDMGTMTRPLPPAWPPARRCTSRTASSRPSPSDTVAVTEHGEPFAAIVQRGHIAGVQFHPEKSGEVGLQNPRNFLQLVR